MTGLSATHRYLPPSARARRRSLWWTAIVLALLAPMAWLINLPYFAASAGPTDDAVDAVIIEEDLAVFHPEGELLLLTVSLQPVNLYEAAIAFFDQKIDLIERESLRPGGETDEEARRRNLRAMDRSKDIAIAVALSELGLEETLAEGVEVVRVFGEAPAFDALSDGDLVVEMESQPVRTVEDIRRILENRRPGDEVQVTVIRNAEPTDLSFALHENPEAPERAMVGITASTAYPIEIDSANYGGPSAGMIYTLAIIDLLEQGELTDGRVVAGTGTISMDGSIGAIGGIRQKLVAAEAAGADVVLVPRDNYDEAGAAPVEVEIVAVETISEAVSYLREGNAGIIEGQ
ncbi:MAG: PDZ domain-containing protein [Acidimicrobiia bacterium]|nr:PDZ domain-containing protein [Acidimicrobiia bacterium]MYB78329.1 PDZ domain-containing protein [Acidimicrobiia bacterium]